MRGYSDCLYDSCTDYLFVITRHASGPITDQGIHTDVETLPAAHQVEAPAMHPLDIIMKPTARG